METEEPMHSMAMCFLVDFVGKAIRLPKTLSVTSVVTVNCVAKCTVLTKSFNNTSTMHFQLNLRS